MVITFDFDDTLKLTKLLRDEDGDIAGIDYSGDEPNPVVFPEFEAALDRGDKVHIVTSRSWSEETKEKMQEWLRSKLIIRDKDGKVLTDRFALLAGIHFTGGQLKRDTLLSLGSQLHYDDDEEEGKALKSTPIRWVRAPLHRSWRPSDDGREDEEGQYLSESLVRLWVRTILQTDSPT
jgi:hypothetical protein